MRIRLFSAFASNNSGSYTLVGRFRDEATAEEVAEVLQRAIDAHEAWHDAHAFDETGDAPLDALARELGLRDARHGRGDDWPQYGPKPTALAAGRQVLVHAPYTVTLPPVFGEAFYAKGGRVEVELDHAHERLAVELTWLPAKVAWGDPTREARLDAFEEALRPMLPGITAAAEHDPRPAIAPAWHRGAHGLRKLTAVFSDLPVGVAVVREVADAHEMTLFVRVWECPHDVADPFAQLRVERPREGVHGVILWRVGEDRVAAMRAAREAMGCGLAEARAAVDDLPKELLTGVSERDAQRAVEALRAAGCEAEVVAPRR
ncbi:MAG: ribosomal protein L7/L12 [Polyangiales bacterium]